MSGLYHSGAHRLLAPYTQGAGVIFTLNQVRVPHPRVFAPNRDLEVAPDFLEAMLDQVEEAGLDVVSLDEAVRRLREDDERRFVCFTFNQGYRDVALCAYPLFKRRSLPLTLYIGTDYASGWASSGGSRSRRWSPEARKSSFAAKEASGICPRRLLSRSSEASSTSKEWLSQRRRGKAEAGDPRARRCTRHRHVGDVPRNDDGLRRDQGARRRPVGVDRFRFKGPLRHGQALSRKGHV
jgi:hypothetical protein